MGYYKRIEVSNSDLSWLKNSINPRQEIDLQQYYDFGNLIDALLTEPQRCNFYNYTLREGERIIQFNKKDFENAELMKQAYLKDEQLRNLLKGATFQEVFYKKLQLNYKGIDFSILARCKYDIWFKIFGLDIKSTSCKTQSEFEKSILYFDYDRQRAFYMDIANCDTDMVVGISKKNANIFKVPINKQSKIYISGKKKYLELAFRWSLIYGEDKTMLL
jgi:hypothetical protein